MQTYVRRVRGFRSIISRNHPHLQRAGRDIYITLNYSRPARIGKLNARIALLAHAVTPMNLQSLKTRRQREGIAGGIVVLIHAGAFTA